MYKFKKLIADRWFDKDLMKTGMEALIVERCAVRIVDGVQAARVLGDLYFFYEPVPNEAGALGRFRS